MAYESITNEWANRENVLTLWEQIVANFIAAAPASKGDIMFWNAASGVSSPTQPSHLGVPANTALHQYSFLGISDGVPMWNQFATPTLAFSDTTTSTPKLSITVQGKTATAVALPAADATHSGIVTIGTQTLAGAKTFLETIHGNKNIEADWGMSAGGIADLALVAAGGGGSVSRLVLCGNNYDPVGGIITVPKSELQTALELGAAAYKGIGAVASGNMGLVTGDSVESAINAALTAAMKIEGETTTAISNGSTTNPITIDGQSVTAYKGMVVFYNSKEFVWTGSSWKELGDESSFALKTTSVTGTGYLTGGGALSQSRTIDISTTAKGYIDTAYSHATDSNRLTTAQTSGFYKFATTAEGHIKSVTAVTQGDLTTLIGSTTYAPYNANGYLPLNGGTMLNTNVVTNLNADLLDGQHGSYYAVKSAVDESINILTISISDVLAIAQDNKDMLDAHDADINNIYGFFDGDTALKAHKLATARNIWGQSFDGTANVSGAMSGVTNIDTIAYFDTTNSRIGIGTNSPDSKLHVSGTFKATGNSVLGGTLSVAGATTLSSTLSVADNISGGKNIQADWGMAAGGIVDLALIGAGGTGTVAVVRFSSSVPYSEDTNYEAESGLLTLPAYPSLTGYATEQWVTNQISALNLGTASTHAHGDYVTSITWDSSSRKLKQSKGGGTATDIVQFGTVYSHGHDEYVTAVSISDTNLSVTKGSGTAVTTAINAATLQGHAASYFAVKSDFDNAVSVLSSGLGDVLAIAQDNKATLDLHDGRLVFLEDSLEDMHVQVDAMTISHYQSASGSPYDTHVIKINGKKLYLKFRAIQADATTNPQTLPAFEISVADNDQGQNEQSFQFGTITEAWIKANCKLS